MKVYRVSEVNFSSNFSITFSHVSSGSKETTICGFATSTCVTFISMSVLLFVKIYRSRILLVYLICQVLPHPVAKTKSERQGQQAYGVQLDRIRPGSNATKLLMFKLGLNTGAASKCGACEEAPNRH